MSIILIFGAVIQVSSEGAIINPPMPSGPTSFRRLAAESRGPSPIIGDFLGFH